MRREQSPEEKKLRDFNRQLKSRNWIDIDFLQGLVARRAIHVKIHNLQPHWKC